MLHAIGLIAHLVAGLPPGETLTVYIDDVPQLTVAVSELTMVRFESQFGALFRVGEADPPVPTLPGGDEGIGDDDEPIPPVSQPAAFTLTAKRSPVSGPVRVSVGVPQRGVTSVRVGLFDATGRLAGPVETVFAGGGSHEVAYSIRGLATGMYFVHATATFADGRRKRLSERVIVVR